MFASMSLPNARDPTPVISSLTDFQPLDTMLRLAFTSLDAKLQSRLIATSALHFLWR